jgi:hypothetical protein
MTKVTDQMEIRSFDVPDEVREFAGHGHADAVTLTNGKTALRSHFEPGWQWSKDVRPIAGTELCQVSHLGFCVAGQMDVTMPSDDGSQVVHMRAGDLARIPPGHDAWVVGEETCVFVDLGDVGSYAQSKE